MATILDSRGSVSRRSFYMFTHSRAKNDQEEEMRVLMRFSDTMDPIQALAEP